MCLMRANPLQGSLEGLGLESRDFFGPCSTLLEMPSDFCSCIVIFHVPHSIFPSYTSIFFSPTYESVVFRSLNKKIFRIIFLYLYRIYLEIFQQCGRKFSALRKISENSGSESENSRPPPPHSRLSDFFRHFSDFSTPMMEFSDVMSENDIMGGKNKMKLGYLSIDVSQRHFLFVLDLKENCTCNLYIFSSL